MGSLSERVLNSLKASQVSRYRYRLKILMSQITVEELTQQLWWDFGRLNGLLISRIQLLPDGKIGGYNHHNESSWSLSGNELTFYDRKGEASTRFTSCIRENGKYFFSGPFLGRKGIKHTLMSKEAYKLDLGLPEDFFINLGDAFRSQQRWQEGIDSYYKAIDVNPTLSGRFYLLEQTHLKLREIHLKLDQKQPAIINYQNSVKHHYLVSHTSKVLYCNIPKNASELFRAIIIKNSDDREFNEYIEQKGIDKFYQYMTKNETKVRVKDFTLLQNKDYFKFAILRNPFNRLVSAYLDKFVKPKKSLQSTLDVVRDAYQRLGKKPDFDRSVTFSQFVSYLSRTTDCDVDIHWRSQYLFLGLDWIDLDFIGRLEDLDTAIEYLREKVGWEIETHRVSKPGHITKYAEIQESTKFHDWLPEKLRSLQSYPQPCQFYNTELEELVRNRYAQDIELYEQKFNTKLELIS